jgi:hypothetical protein
MRLTQSAVRALCSTSARNSRTVPRVCAGWGEAKRRRGVRFRISRTRWSVLWKARDGAAGRAADVVDRLKTSDACLHSYLDQMRVHTLLGRRGAGLNGGTAEREDRNVRWMPRRGWWRREGWRAAAAAAALVAVAGTAWRLGVWALRGKGCVRRRSRAVEDGDDWLASLTFGRQAYERNMGVLR